MTTRALLGLTAVTCASVLTAAGCGGSAGRGSTTPTTYRQARFQPANFAAGPAASNRWLPLRPGTQWVRAGATDVGHRRVPHRVISTVTNISRQIDGVAAIVVLDQGIDSGQLAHESIDYFAEDRQGNVWNVGSYAEAFELGRYVSVRDAWLAGVKGARAGVLMPGDPHVDAPAWFISRPQGTDPDVAQVVKTGQRHCVPFKCYDHVLVVREGKATAIDNELKYYAPGAGQIDNVPRSASKHHDVEQLVNVTRLSSRGLAEAGSEALALDRHARVTSADVFAHGSPAARMR